MKKYKYWEIYDELPKGWVINKYAGSPLAGYVFIQNGNIFKKEFKRALLRVKNEEKHK